MYPYSKESAAATQIASTFKEKSLYEVKGSDIGTVEDSSLVGLVNTYRCFGEAHSTRLQFRKDIGASDTDLVVFVVVVVVVVDGGRGGGVGGGGGAAAVVVLVVVVLLLMLLLLLFWWCCCCCFGGGGGGGAAAAAAADVAVVVSVVAVVALVLVVAAVVVSYCWTEHNKRPVSSLTHIVLMWRIG